jgi:hypothetical protein
MVCTIILEVSTQSAATEGGYNTLAYDESVRGWVSFFDYEPTHVFSLKNNMYTMYNDQLYIHYSPDVNRGRFYGADYPTTISFIFNPNVSLVKNFKTINYEGSNGWEVTSFQSGVTGEDELNGFYGNTNDSTAIVYSYVEGEYIINPQDKELVSIEKKINM